MNQMCALRRVQVQFALCTASDIDARIHYVWSFPGHSCNPVEDWLKAP
jgi:hypothetical protein